MSEAHEEADISVLAVEPVTPDPNTQADDATQDAGLSAEDRAMAMGWTPKGQFKGDPDKWVDAETFVKRGEEFLPFLKANNRRLEQALERATAKTASLEKAVQSAVQHISRADQRAYAKARADLDAELEQYAAAGNVEGVKAVTKDIVDLDKEVIAKPEADGPPPEFQAWMDENPWYGKDRALSAACDAIGQEVFEEGYTGKAQIKEVDRRLREQYPNKFAKPVNPNRALPGAVEGGGPARRPSGKAYGDLPPEARQYCDELVRDKIMTREEYVKTYKWD